MAGNLFWHWASFSWTRLESKTCTWFSHITTFSSAGNLKWWCMLGKMNIERHLKALGHWFTKTQAGVKNVKCVTRLFLPMNRTLCPKLQLWTLHPDPVLMFNSDSFRAQKLWRLIPIAQLCIADGNQTPECQIWLYIGEKRKNIDKKMIC